MWWLPFAMEIVRIFFSGYFNYRCTFEQFLIRTAVLRELNVAANGYFIFQIIIGIIGAHSIFDTVIHYLANQETSNMSYITF